MGLYTNADGLTQQYGLDAGEPLLGQPGVVKTYGSERQLVLDFTYDKLPAFNADLDNDGTNDGFIEQLTPAIPANSHIISAKFQTTVAFTSAGATTLSIGLAEADGSVIDADGIDATIAKTAIDAIGETVLCDGALVGGLAGIGTADGYVYTTVATGPYTAGAGKLTIVYSPIAV